MLLHLLKTGVTQHYHDPLANQIHDFQELSLTYAQISLEKTRTQHRLLSQSVALRKTVPPILLGPHPPGGHIAIINRETCARLNPVIFSDW